MQTRGGAGMNKIQIATNFQLREFQCKDGSYQVVLKRDLLEKLQQLRDLAGKPVIITSGYRNPAYNQKVGGSPTSRHLRGEAADIQIPGLSPQQVTDLAEKVGFNGIGVYETFTHVDVREVATRWRE